MWVRCGGQRRWCWPRAGALAEQDAVEVLQLEVIDGLVLAGQAEAARQAEAQAARVAQGHGATAGG